MIDRGSGTPVVLIPGLQGRWEWMAPTVDALATRCRVLTFSLCDEPTSGFSCDPERGLSNYLRQIDDALDRAGLSEAVVVGVSFGGLIATEYAARRRERVRGLVLVSALPPGWMPDRRARFYLRAPRLLSPLFCLGSPGRLLPEITAAFPRLGDRAGFAVRHGWRVLRAFLSPSRMACRIQWVDHHAFADPHGVDVPSLIVTGEDALDRVVPPPVTRRYLDLLPHVKATVLPRTGHIGLVTKADLFADVITRFADEIAADARRVSA